MSVPKTISWQGRDFVSEEVEHGAGCERCVFVDDELNCHRTPCSDEGTGRTGSYIWLED